MAERYDKSFKVSITETFRINYLIILRISIHTRYFYDCYTSSPHQMVDFFVMSQFEKILDVLDLFTEDSVSLSAEEVGAMLGVSRPTAFRYLKQLANAGMVCKLSGRYALGPRIIELDYRSRRLDPLFVAGRNAIKQLTAQTKCSAMLSGVYGDQVVNIHEDAHYASASNTFGRGRVLPLFRGAASKVILANAPSAKLKRLFESHIGSADVQRIANEWATFNTYFRNIRRKGYYVSRGEVDENVIGVAAPLFNSEGAVVGALTTMFDMPNGSILDTEKIGVLVVLHAQEISARLAEPLVRAD